MANPKDGNPLLGVIEGGAGRDHAAAMRAVMEPVARAYTTAIKTLDRGYPDHPEREVLARACRHARECAGLAPLELEQEHRAG